MIKLTLGQIFVMKDALRRLAEQPMPAAVSYRFSKILGRTMEELAAIDKEHLELVKKHGEPVKDSPETFKVKNECAEEFRKEFAQLMEVEVEIAADKIALPDTVGISVADLNALEPLLIPPDAKE